MVTSKETETNREEKDARRKCWAAREVKEANSVAKVASPRTLRQRLMLSTRTLRATG